MCLMSNASFTQHHAMQNVLLKALTSRQFQFVSELAIPLCIVIWVVSILFL